MKQNLFMRSISNAPILKGDLQCTTFVFMKLGFHVQ